MKYIYWIVIVFILLSCSRNKISRIENLSVKVMSNSNLKELVNPTLGKSSINNITIEVPGYNKIFDAKTSYDSLLVKLNLRRDFMDEILEEVFKLNIRTMNKINGNLIWIDGGAFGDISGYIYSEVNNIAVGDTILIHRNREIIVKQKKTDKLFYFY